MYIYYMDTSLELKLKQRGLTLLRYGAINTPSGKILRFLVTDSETSGWYFNLYPYEYTDDALEKIILKKFGYQP